MRIGLFTDRFGPGLGGAELYLRELAGWLVAHGDEPILFGMDRPADFPSRTVAVDPGPWPRGLREKHLARLLLATARREGCAVTLSIRPFPGADFFQPHGGAMDAAWQGRGESKEGWRRGLWFLGHLFDLKFRLLRSLEAQSIQKARAVFPVSQHSAETFRRSYPGLESKIRAIPLGVDLVKFSPQGDKAPLRSELKIAPTAAIALFVAQDFELKGLRAAIATVQTLRAQGREISLVVLGADRRRSRWEGVPLFLGTKADPAPYFRAADLLLHPTFFDPCARVVLEALACGLPVVTTRRNGAFSQENSGIEAVEDPRDAQALAGSCLRMLAIPRPTASPGFLSPTRASHEHFRMLREAMMQGS